MNYILENTLLVPTKLNISLKKILNYFLLKKSKKQQLSEKFRFFRNL